MSLELIALLVVAGVLIGLFSALFGVGGGILMVPLMVLVLDRSQQLAEGTSLLVIVPTAIAGVLAQRRSGLVSFPHAGLLAVGGTVGALAGVALALNLSHETLQWIFGLMLVVTGIRLVRDGIAKRRLRARLGMAPEEQPASR
jgi:uncharacterized membrane protein YfcA